MGMIIELPGQECKSEALREIDEAIVHLSNAIMSVCEPTYIKMAIDNALKRLIELKKSLESS